MYNDKNQIKKWIIHATSNIKDENTKIKMRTLAYELADKGEWRGNISDAWARSFDTEALIRDGQLGDLYR